MLNAAKFKLAVLPKTRFKSKRLSCAESRKAVEAVKSSVIPPASKTDVPVSHRAAKSPDTHYSSNSSSFTSSPAEEDEVPSDTSPGRAQQMLGTANVQKTSGVSFWVTQYSSQQDGHDVVSTRLSFQQNADRLHGENLL